MGIEAELGKRLRAMELGQNRLDAKRLCKELIGRILSHFTDWIEARARVQLARAFEALQLRNQGRTAEADRIRDEIRRDYGNIDENPFRAREGEPPVLVRPEFGGYFPNLIAACIRSLGRDGIIPLRTAESIAEPWRDPANSAEATANFLLEEVTRRILAAMDDIAASRGTDAVARIDQALKQAAELADIFRRRQEVTGNEIDRADP